MTAAGKGHLKSPVFIAAAIAIFAGAFLMPAAPFIIDGGIYYQMAQAMAEHGALFIADTGGVDSAPPLAKQLTIIHNEKVYPQYPSGYALLAAPFFKVLGVRGLIVMNALGFAASIWLTFAIGRRLYDEQIGAWSAAIFALATFAPTYAFAIWPHMVSLAFWLGAIYAAILAQATPARRDALGLYILSGLLIGAALNIRIDAFLAALTIFFWLRIFSRPDDRLAPLALAIGAAPGLLLSAWLNQLKFGAFTPFSYGDSVGNDSLGRYAAVIALVGAAGAAAWAFNLPRLAQKTRATRHPRIMAWLAAAGLVAILALTPAGALAWRMAKGVYVLVVNLQAHDAYYQAGVERNEYGHLLFWGYPKKALLQSLPWAPLITAPALFLFRGRAVSGTSLCLLAIAGPIAFYALNQWHGGGSYSMRYFIPTLPFLAILGASGLRWLTAGAGIRRQTALIALLSACIIFAALQQVGLTQERFMTPTALYPQWLIAAALCAAICIAFSAPPGARKGFIASWAALFALGYGLAVNLYEGVVHARTLAEQRAMARDISAPIDAGALVITGMPLSFIPAEQRGVQVMTIWDKSTAGPAAAAHAFADEGRCVYFHNSYARDLAAEALGRPIDPAPLWAASRRFSGDPRLAFFVLEGARADCGFDAAPSGYEK